jgi:hypothetical protein
MLYDVQAFIICCYTFESKGKAPPLSTLLIAMGCPGQVLGKADPAPKPIRRFTQYCWRLDGMYFIANPTRSRSWTVTCKVKDLRRITPSCV